VTSQAEGASLPLEAAKFAEALLGWAQRATAPLLAGGDQAPRCPLCRVLGALHDPDPAAIQQVTHVITEAATGLAGLLATLADRHTAATPSHHGHPPSEEHEGSGAVAESHGAPESSGGPSCCGSRGVTSEAAAATQGPENRGEAGSRPCPCSVRHAEEPAPATPSPPPRGRLDTIAVILE
jgi:hypothetical protein